MKAKQIVFLGYVDENRQKLCEVKADMLQQHNAGAYLNMPLFQYGPKNSWKKIVAATMSTDDPCIEMLEPVLTNVQHNCFC